jgi:putative nucleotidyltransferase with HDIG domain
VVLGEEGLLQTIVSAAMERMFPESRSGYSLCKGGLFYHALGTARLTHELALSTGKAPPAVAYTSGLLHDIGKTVLDQYVSALAPRFLRPSGTLMEMEKSSFGVDHCEVGARLAVNWGLPNNLAEVIRLHHSPDEATTDADLVALVYLANFVMSQFRTGYDFELLSIHEAVWCLERLEFDPGQFQDLMAHAFSETLPVFVD